MSLKNFIIIFFLLTIKCEYNQCDDDIDPEMRATLTEHCPEFLHWIDSCSNLASALEAKQKQLQESSIFQAIDKLEKSKVKYEDLQKQVDQCKKKAVSKCKDIAIKTYNALTQLNDYYSQIMTIMHAKDSAIPAPVKKTENLEEGISFTILTNFDENIFNKQLSHFIATRDDLDSITYDKISDLIDKVEATQKTYIDNNEILQKCLTNASTDCHSLISSTYSTFNDMNNAIATAMSGLHQKFPELMPEPKKESEKIDNNITITKVTNFDGGKFTKALTAYKELILPSLLLKELAKCQSDDKCKDKCTDPSCAKDMNCIKAKCQQNLKEFATVKQREAIASLGMNIIGTLGGMHLIEQALAAFDVPTILTGTVLIGVTFIPAVSDAIDSFFDWIAHGIFGKKEDTSYYKEFLLLFELPIKKDTIERIKSIIRDKIEKAQKIKRDTTPTESSKPARDTIGRDTISPARDTSSKPSRDTISRDSVSPARDTIPKDTIGRSGK